MIATSVSFVISESSFFIFSIVESIGFLDEHLMNSSFELKLLYQ